MITMSMSIWILRVWCVSIVTINGFVGPFIVAPIVYVTIVMIM